MQFLATLWFPSTDPIGDASVTALLIAAVLVYLTGRFSFLSSAWRRDLILLAPVFLFAAAAITQGSPVFRIWYHGRYFPNAPDFAAGYMYMALGFGYSLHLLRMPSIGARRMGALFGFLFGGLIAAEAVKLNLATSLLRSNRDWLPVSTALGIFAVFWIGMTWFVARRRASSKKDESAATER